MMIFWMGRFFFSFIRLFCLLGFEGTKSERFGILEHWLNGLCYFCVFVEDGLIGDMVRICHTSHGPDVRSSKNADRGGAGDRPV